MVQGGGHACWPRHTLLPHTPHPARRTMAAAMSMISVGSLRLPNHRRKKFLGGMALNWLQP